MQTLKPGISFLDCGAHIGYFTILAAGLVALALMPAWLVLLTLVFDKSAPVAGVHNAMVFFDELITSGMFWLCVPPALLTGLAFHALVRFTHRSGAFRVRRIAT